MTGHLKTVVSMDPLHLWGLLMAVCQEKNENPESEWGCGCTGCREADSGQKEGLLNNKEGCVAGSGRAM